MIGFLFTLYICIQCGCFGLLIGLAAENAKSFRHYAFLWLMSFAWPVIYAYVLMLKKETSHD